MKVVIRKMDSTTSLLLFVYNCLSHFNKESLKLSGLLEIMKVFGKSETAARMSLSRATKAGILINNRDSEVCYSLAPRGKEAIRKWNEAMQQFWRRYALRNSPWNGKWHLLHLEFEEEHQKKRLAIVEQLQQFGFGILSANTWLCPYNGEEIKKLCIEYNAHITYFEMYGKINVNQDIQDFAKDIYPLDEVAKSYLSFMKTLRKYQHWNALSKEQVESGESLPLLHVLGWEFFSAATADAMLPKELIPEWIGDEAAQMMSETRKVLLEATLKYLARFID